MVDVNYRSMEVVDDQVVDFYHHRLVLHAVDSYHHVLYYSNGFDVHVTIFVLISIDFVNFVMNWSNRKNVMLMNDVVNRIEMNFDCCVSFDFDDVDVDHWTMRKNVMMNEMNGNEIDLKMNGNYLMMTMYCTTISMLMMMNVVDVDVDDDYCDVDVFDHDVVMMNVTMNEMNDHHFQ